MPRNNTTKYAVYSYDTELFPICHRRINGSGGEDRMKPSSNRSGRSPPLSRITQKVCSGTCTGDRIGDRKPLFDTIHICQGLRLHLDEKLRLTPAFLHDARPGHLPRTTALLSHPLETIREKAAVRSLAFNTKALHDQLSRERALFLNPPIQDVPMVGAHCQYTWTASLPIKPSTQPNCASPPPSAPVSPLSTNRLPSLLVLIHHLLEETSRFNNKAFCNIGFHTMQMVSRRLGVKRIVRPRWSFVTPCTCSTPRTPSRPPTASSGGRYARGPCGSGGIHGPQPAAGSTQPRQPRNVDPLTSGD
jgi:hypothetical protein